MQGLEREQPGDWGNRTAWAVDSELLQEQAPEVAECRRHGKIATESRPVVPRREAQVEQQRVLVDIASQTVSVRGPVAGSRTAWPVDSELWRQEPAAEAAGRR